MDDNVQVTIANILTRYFITSDRTITLNWMPDTMLPREINIDPSSLLLNITLHRFIDEENILETITVLEAGVPNNGTAEVTIPVSNSNDINSCVISLTLYDPIINNLDRPVSQWCTNVWVFSKKDNIDRRLLKECTKWSQNEPKDVSKELITRTMGTPCPPNVIQALTPNSGLVKVKHSFLTKFFSSNC